MATWAKNQIAKQLAKFAKNLDPNSLSLKFFKGEGELNNLELDEAMLSDLLEFPPWLQLTKVTCNKITAKVPWTSLKSDPIRLHLDRVEVQIVASETAREKAAYIPAFANKSNTKPSKYGFTEKVVDGMYVSINTVFVSFTSLGFKASVNVSRIIVQSTTPEWKQTNNLRNTRIKDDGIGETLNFKEIKWGTMRVDADAAYAPESKDVPSTPLRLITNNSAVRLVIKKRISDCQMVASKLGIILDDILWVLTRSQILKLSSFIHYLIRLRSKFLPITHQTASHLHKQDTQQTSAPQQQQASQNQLFSVYNLTETSIHLRTQRVDLHLCDDSTLHGNLSQNIKESSEKSRFDEAGAALQLFLSNISLDHCPYHIVGRKRTVLNMDNEVTYQRNKWAMQLMNNFQETEGKQWNQPRNTPSMLRNPNRRRRPVLFESFVAVMVQDFKIMQVTTATSREPGPFLASEKETLFLPKEMAAVYLDHTAYYYMEELDDLLVPAPNVFVQVNPIQLTFDPLTCVWLNRFGQSVMAGLDWTKEFMSNESGFAEHVNVRVEALMPKIIIPLKNDSSLSHFDERPSGMQLQISQAVVSNCRVGLKCSQADILNDLQSFLNSRHYADLSCFPNQPTDYASYSNCTWLNDFSINYHQLQNLTKRDKRLYDRLKRDNNLPHQIWCVWCDQLWIEFTGIEKASNRPVTFVDAFPLRLWICQSIPYYSNTNRSISSESITNFELTCETIEIEGNIQGNPAAQSSRKTSSINFISKESITSDSSLQPEILNPNGADLYRDIANTSLRTTHSDTDLVCHHQHGVETQSLREFNFDKTNCTKGGPPPPYTMEQAYSIFDNTSLSQPPTYDDAVNEGDVGEISKTPITDIIDFNDENCRRPAMAVLLNVVKTVRIQLDHFQLLYLMRISEVFQAVSEKIASDNERCERERKVSLDHLPVKQVSIEGESSIINVFIPNIAVDLVLHPCIGIDPIQQLSLADRIEYGREVNERPANEFLSGSSTSCLPVRRKSVSPSDRVRSESVRSLCSSNYSSSCGQHLQTGTKESPLQPVEQIVHYSQQCIDAPGMHLSLSEKLIINEQVYDGTLKEVRDMAVQVGDSLMKINLKPQAEHQLISLLRATLRNVNVCIQSDGCDTVVKVAAEKLEVNELGNMKYGKILDPRGDTAPEKENTKQQVNMNSLTGDGTFKMRLISGPSAEQYANGGKDLGFAVIHVQSFAAALLMSTVDNLMEFAEDEFVLPTMPFTVNISCSDISLYDDKPRRYQSAIKLPPSQILINNLQVERNINGVITLNYNSKNSDLEDDATPIAFQHVNSLTEESISQQVDALIGENGRLLEDFKVVNAKVNGLYAERESLLNVIDKLQQELMISNRDNEELQNRVRTLLNRSRGNYV